MKKLTYLFAFILVITGVKVKADEGMWLPMFIDRLNYVDMQEKGLQLTPEEIYSVNKASLKDAIVGLSGSPKPNGYFCTGEIVSPEGLMFTNHHCGFDIIQNHSTVAHDYLKDGFWAMSREEELPNENLTASFLVRMADVTDSIIPFLSDTLDARERSAAVRKISSRMKKANSEDDRYNVVVKSFFGGNEYYLFVYEVFTDVRLVGAPPSSIGKYGGDTDNWMWPRHTGDFSIFRVYTAPDGSPADYAEENIPLKAKHYLPVSLDGVQQNDFAMIWGFPGSTSRYLTSESLDFQVSEVFPPLVEIFGKKLEVWKEHMDADQAVKIQYASNYASTANSWKYFIGQMRGVENLGVVDQKKEFEAEFQTWAEADETRKEKYGSVVENINTTMAGKRELFETYISVIYLGVAGADLMGYALDYSGLEGAMKQLKEEKDKEKKAKKQEEIDGMVEELKAGIPDFFKEHNMKLDQDVFASMTEMFYNNLDASYRPEYLVKLHDKFKGDFDAIAAYVYENSFVASETGANEFLNDPSLKTMSKDPAFQLAQGFMAKQMEVTGIYRSAPSTSADNRKFIQGIREMSPDKFFYPDANSTLRFTYGQVLDYEPADAVHFDYITHLSGVMEKEDPDSDEFMVDPKLKELYETKDYGPYGTEDGRLVVCFLSNNDITGGNSGSPVMNGKGELIGLAFDGNWEAMSGDLAFEPDIQRTIVVDSRYVLFVIDKFAGAGHLVDELTIKKKMPEPSRTIVREEVETDE